MALRAQSITAQLARLSMASIRPSACTLANKSIGAVRFLTTESNSTTSATTLETAAPLPPVTTTIKTKLNKDGKEIPAYETPEGHGERIWFFRHMLEGMTIFSLTEHFKVNKSLRMLPFTGKKLKPSSFRKDYWEVFAMMEFPSGKSLAGLSAHHMLREARFLHNYVWDPKTPGLTKNLETGKPLKKIERGIQLNAQQFPNTIADMAVVLSGAGKGNKIWTESPSRVENHETIKKEDGTEETRTVVTTTDGVRLPVTIYWAVPSYKDYAPKWSDNVKHADLANVERTQPVPRGKPIPALNKYQIRNKEQRELRKLGKRGREEAALAAKAKAATIE